MDDPCLLWFFYLWNIFRRYHDQSGQKVQAPDFKKLRAGVVGVVKSLLYEPEDPQGTKPKQHQAMQVKLSAGGMGRQIKAGQTQSGQQNSTPPAYPL
jgi:hypothetical protein